MVTIKTRRGVGARGGNIQISPAGGGISYAVAPTGDLLWYRHEGREDGTPRWTDNNGRKVGSGWNYREVFSGGDGVIYAVTTSGDLLWYRHEGREDGTPRWTANNGRKVGSGW